jgi:ABC-type glycerol-3-phosphate transport system permease component
MKILLMRPGNAVLFVLLWIMVFLSVAPFVFMVLGSFKSNHELFTLTPSFFPQNGFNFDKYVALFEYWPFLRNLVNSLIVSSIVTVSVTVTSLFVGYSLAKFSFPGRAILTLVIISTLMVPFETRLVPTYVLFRNLGLINTYAGLVIPGLVTAFGIFMIRQFAIDSVPDELLEAARLDGASEFQILHTIVAPVLAPALVSLALLTFINSWNDFLWPLVAVANSDMFTVSVALRSLADPSNIADYGMVLAAAVVSVIPVLTVFAIFNKQITTAVIQGAGRES